MKQLVVTMPEHEFFELETLAGTTHRSVTDLLRLGLALAKVVVEETSNRNRIMIASEAGKPLREVLFPK